MHLLWAASCFLTFTFALGNVTAADWPQWRGANRDGHAITSITKWPKTLRRQWRVVVGEGHSSPVVVGRHIFIFARQDDNEILRCLNLKDGKEVWSKKYTAAYKMHAAARGHGKGPKSTPLVADGRVYTFGISGILTCFDAKTGRKIWRREFSKAYRFTSPLYGVSMSPLLTGGLLIAHVGGHNKGALMAFDAKTGATKWDWEEDGPAYTSPILHKTSDTTVLVTQSQRAHIAVDPKTGKELWRRAFKTAYDQNSVTPVVFKDTVIVSGYGNGTQAYRLQNLETGWKAKEIWSSQRYSMYMSTPVVHGKLLFGLSHRSSGQLFCASAETGKVFWTGKGRFSKNAAFLAVGNAILVQKTDGEILVIEPTFHRMTVLARYRVSNSATWAHPALVGSQLLVKDKTTLICFSAE